VSSQAKPQCSDCFFKFTRIDHAVVWNYDNIRRTRIATFPQTAARTGNIGNTGWVKNGVDRSAIKDFADSGGSGVVFEHAHDFAGVAGIGEPELGNVILGQPEPVVGIVVDRREKTTR